ncbi:MAG: serine/threonine-protein phosphatase [Candidatus Tectomicrobia bacterium]|uniref:Serine/threonine-protein phosphatase n=1 Tax=Tectimicrobiota bacterium TaxID=2528274 RepID=A0A937W6K4_UNCTE|nr:serine/threonine-protein phosphatase [Candidatus Tectomicrobia bacterium]
MRNLLIKFDKFCPSTRAISKTLCKSMALRGHVPLDVLMTAVNQEIARDNPEELFITAIAGILDIHTGALELCSAGHESPILLRHGAEPCALSVTGGPPLCMLEDFVYPSETLQLQSGDLLLLMTDGVTEAQDMALTLYGIQRVLAYCRTIQDTPEPWSVVTLVQGLYDAVKDFERDTEPADDITIMMLRYTTPTLPIQG